MALPALPGALRDPRFRLFFAGQALSLLGDGMVPVALAFAVLDLTGSASDLGYVFAARSIPLVALLLAGGVFADRLSRRAVMVAADVVRCVVFVLLGGLLVAGAAELWEVILLQAIGGAATAFFMPAISGIVPDTVAPEHLQEANSLRGIADSAGSVAGPALAGVLVALAGPGWALVADGATFAGSACSLVLLRLPRQADAPTSTLLRDLAEGFAEFRSRRWLWAANAAAAAMNAASIAPFFVLGPVIARRSLGGAGAWALILAANGAGAIAGGVVGIRVRFRRPMLVAMAVGTFFALPVAALALRLPAPVVALAAAFAGAGGVLVNALWETTLQEQVPPAALSRVVAYDWLASVVVQPLGFALAGVLAGTALGVAGTLWLGSALVLSATVGAMLVPDVRRIEARGAQQKRGR